MIIFIISFGETSACPVPFVSDLLPTQTPPFGEEQSGMGCLSGAGISKNASLVSGQGCHGRASPPSSFTKMTFHTKGKGFRDLQSISILQTRRPRPTTGKATPQSPVCFWILEVGLLPPG